MPSPVTPPRLGVQPTSCSESGCQNTVTAPLSIRVSRGSPSLSPHLCMIPSREPRAPCAYLRVSHVNRDRQHAHSVSRVKTEKDEKKQLGGGGPSNETNDATGAKDPIELDVEDNAS